MATRATYSFINDDGSYCTCYKHFDGYPSGAFNAIEGAKKLAWELPRWEADDFAAAFVAANKTSPGDVRLMLRTSDDRPFWVADSKYHYDIRGFVFGQDLKDLYVEAWATNFEQKREKWTQIYVGSLAGLAGADESKPVDITKNIKRSLGKE